MPQTWEIRLSGLGHLLLFASFLRVAWEVKGQNMVDLPVLSCIWIINVSSPETIERRRAYLFQLFLSGHKDTFSPNPSANLPSGLIAQHWVMRSHRNSFPPVPEF